MTPEDVDSRGGRWVTIKLGPVSRLLVSVLPASCLYCLGLYLVILLFLLISVLAAPPSCPHARGAGLGGAYVKL